MPSLWSDTIASLTGDAGAQARVSAAAKKAASVYDSARSLIGSAKPAPQPVVAAPVAVNAVGLLPGGFSMAQISVGISAVAVVLCLALRGRR